jgi:protein-tyrosine phosphatase
MIDLHTHVLPGIDDGARSLEDAVAMCRLAAEDGCTALVATPHQRRGAWVNCDRATLAALRDAVQEAVGPGLRILPGGEIHAGPGMLDEIDRIEELGLLPLGGSRCLLIEFGPGMTPAKASELVHELHVAGWRPILAHPEFFPWLVEEPGALERLVDLGALVQVTAMSVTGDFGAQPAAIVQRLLDAGLVHFVASDCHGTSRRPPGLRRALRTIAKRMGEELARRLVFDNPTAALEGRPVPALDLDTAV